MLANFFDFIAQSNLLPASVGTSCSLDKVAILTVSKTLGEKASAKLATQSLILTWQALLSSPQRKCMTGLVLLHSYQCAIEYMLHACICYLRLVVEGLQI